MRAPGFNPRKIIRYTIPFINFLTKRKRKDSAQLSTLRNLIHKGRNSDFGRHYSFAQLLKQKDLLQAFRSATPVHTYSDLNKNWWKSSLHHQKNISWPGKIKYFALSSGTSDAASKRLPVSSELIRQVRKVGLMQIASFRNFNLPVRTFEKKVLMLGGTISLKKTGSCYEGDMSGISAIHMPAWISGVYYLPDNKISRLTEWQARIDKIVDEAPNWDVGMICGIPSWVQLVLEKIIKHHQLRNIHQIWPDLNVYIHGGVSFQTYREGFAKLLGKPVTYIETYMASEGSFGFQPHPDAGICLVPDAGIFYEFIPFDRHNFDEDGNLRSNPQVVALHEVAANTPYALVITTCAGLWRYLIGDVLEFTNTQTHEIKITGRTKHFLNLCGEHVSADNLASALRLTADDTGLDIPEFAVSGINHNNSFEYHWYLGCNDWKNSSPLTIAGLLDKKLCQLNDDYLTERQAGVISCVSVTLLPADIFHSYLKSIKKEGGMNKFPRVLKEHHLPAWKKHLEQVQQEKKKSVFTASA